jgi:prophage tail gpP-like protein
MLASVAQLQRSIAELDKVQLVIKGDAFVDWLQTDIDSDIFTAADAFTVQAPVPSKADRARIREGSFLDVYVGDARQLSGVIDDIDYSGDRKLDRLSIVGRDKGALLLDSEAKPLVAQNNTLATLAERLVEPHGIKVITSNEANRALVVGKKDRRRKARKDIDDKRAAASIKRKYDEILPGYRIAQILDDYTHKAGLLWWITARGELFIGKPNYTQQPRFSFVAYAPGSALAAGNNVEAWGVRRSMRERYSHVEIAGQGFGPNGKIQAKGAKFTAVATDPDLIRRGIERRQRIIDSDVQDEAQARARALYEMARHRLNALAIKLTVPEFRQGGALYATDTMAHVKIEAADIDGAYYIAQRRFTETRGRRRCQLTLIEPGVFLP